MSVADCLGVAVLVDSLVGGEPLQPDNIIITHSDPITSRLLMLGDTVVVAVEVAKSFVGLHRPLLIET
jgi:hypothetical protein